MENLEDQQASTEPAEKARRPESDARIQTETLEAYQ